MATKTTKTKTTTKKGKGLTKKYGPFPLWVYLGVVGIVVLYLYYRHRHSQSGQSPATTTGGYVQPQPSNGLDVVPSGNANTSTGDTGTSTAQPVNFPSDYATQTDLANAVDSVNNNVAASIAGITFPQPNVNITVPTGPSSSVSKTTTTSKTAAKKAAPAQPFGGVTKTVKLKTGAVLTYYKSGRIIEQAPGKTAYVVHK